jgi:hypothetical protein
MERADSRFSSFNITFQQINSIFLSQQISITSA